MPGTTTMTEYELALERWVRRLDDYQLVKYIENLKRFSDAEADALVLEDIRRFVNRGFLNI